MKKIIKAISFFLMKITKARAYLIETLFSNGYILEQKTHRVSKVFGVKNKNLEEFEKWKELFFASDYDFARKFGNVNAFLIKSKKILDLTNDNEMQKTFEQISNDYLSKEQAVEIYKNGNILSMESDKYGFYFKLIDVILDYSKNNNYDAVKLFFYYFSTKTTVPIIYFALDKNIVQEINN